MALDADPYRTLGLPRGASVDEVKRAYRRLAKINHPDAAGEMALPRFLAIQAAYEQLIGGSAATGKGRRAGSTARRPWESEPDGSGATSRAYSGRAKSEPPGARRTQPGATGPTGATGRTDGPTGRTDGPTGRADGPTGRTGRRRPEPRSRARGTTDEPPRSSKGRPRNKATFGPTSYDGADAGPFEPDWGGASWYGTTSGTYWTLNPKEYADPRKHGPEYQARARRTARARSEAGTTAAAGGGAAGTDPDPEADGTTDPAAHGRSAGPTHTTSSWWDSTAGAAGPADAADRADGRSAGAGTTEYPGTAARRGPRPTGARPTASTTEPPPPDLGRAAADITRALTDERFGGLRGRLARAVIGWLPIAFGIGWLVGELTGCSRFAATCDGGVVDPVTRVLQVAALALLVLVPAAASAAAMGALTLLVAAVAASLILSATGSAADGDSRRLALGVILLVAWLVGLVIAIARWTRTLGSPTSPVS